MNAKNELVKAKGASSELVERHFNLSHDNPPLALAEAAAGLAALAERMSPDDVSVDIDLPAGKLHFRCYRRADPGER